MATPKPAYTTTMDEATRIVAELQAKVDELDLKIWQYRRDMAAEFNKYAEGILRDTPKDVSDTVSMSFADTFKKYKSLNLNASGGIESRPAGNSEGFENTSPSYSTNTTTPNLSDRLEGESEVPRSPHERDTEFVGVFTQPYLPLLDNTRQHEFRSNNTISAAIDKGKQKEVEDMSGDASTETRSLAASPEFRRPSTPRRKNTDEGSVVSATSDHSDGPVRRSALRRVESNSANAQSPRRVRFFNVDGFEAPTSSSPRTNDAVSSELEPYSSRLPSDSSGDEGDSEQIEDIESPPAPKRISSSQRLRALSRTPLDDGTNWTQLKAPPDGSASVAGLSSTDDGSDDEGLEFGTGNGNGIQGSASGTAPEPIPAGYTSHQTSEADDTNDEVATVSDDEDTLGMPPLRRTSRSEAASILSPIGGPNIDDNKTPTSATRSPSKPALDLDASTQASKGAQDSKSDDVGDGEGDDFFLFDDEDSKARDLPDSRLDESDNESLPAPTKEKSEAESTVLVRSASSTSPPIMNPTQNTAKSPTRPLSGVAGSYKGRAFGFPVASEEIQAQVAGVHASSFVGSVNGNSGMDAGDLQSFKESLRQGPGSFMGEPKSMSERMMFDDMMEAEKAAKRNKITKP
jgi:hypothetical protein